MVLTNRTANHIMEPIIASTSDATFAEGEKLGGRLRAGDTVLLIGGLGAGKTLFTKGILEALGFDIDEVTSPSFTLVNLYHTENFVVYHIDLWRLDNRSDAAFEVGLADIYSNENAIVIIEWAEKLKEFDYPSRTLQVRIEGDGDEPRQIQIDEIRAPCTGGQRSLT